MALMALDHARLFFGPNAASWNLPSRASAAHFFTWWLPHLCGPVFVFLAGVSAALWLEKKGDRPGLSRYLLTRGALLVVLEFTVVRWSWRILDPNHIVVLQVLWVLGVGMMLLAALHWLPRWLLAVLGVALIALQPPEVDHPLWLLLFDKGGFVVGGVQVAVLWPLAAWLGLMLLGWVAGPQMKRPKVLLAAGGALCLGFVALRYSNVWGDVRPWYEVNRAGVYTLISFLNTSKHPASPLFLMMTMGPALLLLARLDRLGSRVGAALEWLGRAPLFFYVVHIPLLHVAAAGWWAWQFPDAERSWWIRPVSTWPEDYVLSLGLVYGASLAAVAVMLPLCAGYGRLKASRRIPWLRYF
jgi:uncharacterized membrane protein